MTFFGAWCLKMTRFTTGQVDDKTGRLKLFYNESLAFYIMVHIFEGLDYNRVYGKDMSKTKMVDVLNHLEDFFRGSLEDIMERLFDECDC